MKYKAWYKQQYKIITLYLKSFIIRLKCFQCMNIIEQFNLWKVKEYQYDMHSSLQANY